MRDTQERDDPRPAPWLELRSDALHWIAGKRDAWWYGPDERGDRTLNLLRLSADTGLDDNTVYRLASYAKNGGRVSLKTDTVAHLVRLGAREHGVKDSTAFDRIFRIHDPARERRLEAVAA